MKSNYIWACLLGNLIQSIIATPTGLVAMHFNRSLENFMNGSKQHVALALSVLADWHLGGSTRMRKAGNSSHCVCWLCGTHRWDTPSTIETGINTRFLHILNKLGKQCNAVISGPDNAHHYFYCTCASSSFGALSLLRNYTVFLSMYYCFFSLRKGTLLFFFSHCE